MKIDSTPVAECETNFFTPLPTISESIGKVEVMKITNIEKIPVVIPYHERVRGHLQRCWNLANRATDDEYRDNYEKYLAEWRSSSPPQVETCIYQVHTDSGIVGLGEGGDISDGGMQSYLGKNPFEFILNDGTRALQIAFYDIMGKAVGLPMAQLFGPMQRENVKIAYWSHCFPPEVLQQEAKIAVENGFRAHKIKRRAHTDILEQIGVVSEVIPEDYHIAIDANATFGTTDRAIDIGRKLEVYPQVKCLESPIAQDNIEGYLFLKQRLPYRLAIHAGTPGVLKAINTGMCDYFVVSGGAAGIIETATVADAGGLEFWIQMGDYTGISAMFMIQIASAIRNASLGHVSLYFLLENYLLTEPIVVEEGCVKIPSKPGLGVEVDMDAVEQYRVG